MRYGQAWLVPVLVLVVGTFVAVLDVTIVNVALPRIQTDFGADAVDIQWVATVYALTVGVLVPASGWLSDRFGLRRVYIVALVGFAVTSVLCGLAWDLPSLVVFRILQAVPGGVLPVVTLAMVYRIVPAEEIGAAMGTFGLGVVLAPAIGPTLGGYLVEYLDWRLIFFINLPVGLLGALAAFLVLNEFDRPPATPFDVLGFAAIAGGMFALLLAFTKAPDWGWSSYRVGMLLVFGVLALATFVVIELEVRHPLLDVRLFARWSFSGPLLVLGALSVGMFAVLFFIPLFLQQVQGVTPLRTGWIMFPEAIVMGVLAPLSGVLYDKIGVRWPAFIGLLIAAYASWLMCGLTPQTPDRIIVRWTCLRGVGNALAMMAIITAGLAAVSRSKTNEASAINNVGQRISSALGLALLVALVSSSQAQLMADRAALVSLGTVPDPQLLPTEPGQLLGLWAILGGQVTTSAYANMFVVVTVVTLVGALLALTLRPARHPDPARPDSTPADETAGASATATDPTDPADSTGPSERAEPPEPRRPGDAAIPEPARSEPARSDAVGSDAVGSAGSRS